jgi:hypothetical protein
MPAEELLNIAVKYLSSINETLKAQLDFEKSSYQEQARAEREAIIENKPPTTSTFNVIKNRLSGFKSDVKDNVSVAADIAKFAAILGGASVLIASALDQKQLDALKENVEQFKKKFGWLGDLASMIPAGGIFGFLFGGKGLKGRLRGGMVGIIAEAVATIAFNKMTGQGGGDSSAVNIAAVGGIGYLGYRGAKSGISTFGKIKDARTKMANLSASKSYYDPNTGRMRSAAAGKVGQFASTKGATGFLKSPRWQKFLNWLTKNGKRKLVTKIQQRIAVAVTSGAIAATGVGAAFGAIGFLLNFGFSLYLMYEIYELWKSFTAEEDASKLGAGDAQIEKELKKTDATKVAGTVAGSNAQTQIPVSNQAILATIRTKESGNNYSAQNPESTASGAYQFVDGTWQALTKKYGIGTEYSKAKFAPPQIQDAVADKFVSEILQQAGGDVSKVPVAWYTGNIQGSSSAASPEQVAAYQADWLRVYNGGNPDSKAAATNGSYTSSSSGAPDLVNSGAEQMGKIFGMIGSTVIKPGVARNFTPAGSNVSEQINTNSMKLQNDITFGIQKEKSKDKITTPTIPAGTPRGVRPVKAVSNIDPNYQNIDVLGKYLAHFRMAA